MLMQPTPNGTVQTANHDTAERQIQLGLAPERGTMSSEENLLNYCSCYSLGHIIHWIPVLKRWTSDMKSDARVDWLNDNAFKVITLDADFTVYTHSPIRLKNKIAERGSTGWKYVIQGGGLFAPINPETNHQVVFNTSRNPVNNCEASPCACKNGKDESRSNA